MGAIGKGYKPAFEAVHTINPFAELETEFLAM
jgi:hypothetical protein